MRPRLGRLALLPLTVLVLSAAAARPAAAALLRPDIGLVFPQVGSASGGTLTYTPGADGGGRFVAANVPHLLVAGHVATDQYPLTADAGSVLDESVSLNLDAQGHLLPAVDPADNTYTLTGHLVYGGQTYDGVLLTGKATDFGSIDLDSVGLKDEDFFDMDLDITGGLIAGLIGPEAYLRWMVEKGSTFNGRFDQPFAGSPVASVLIPTPEPAALVVLIAGVGALAWRRRRALIG